MSGKQGPDDNKTILDPFRKQVCYFSKGHDQ